MAGDYPSTEEEILREDKQLKRDYDNMVKAFDENIESFFESLEIAAHDLVMDAKVPLIHDKLVEKVFDETPQDLQYKQLVKETFVEVLNDVQWGQDIKRTLGNLPREAVDLMKRWCDEHHDAPYPTDAEKQALSKELGLSTAQISQWFSNYRKRVWRPSLRNESNLH